MDIALLQTTEIKNNQYLDLGNSDKKIPFNDKIKHLND